MALLHQQTYSFPFYSASFFVVNNFSSSCFVFSGNLIGNEFKFRIYFYKTHLLQERVSQCGVGTRHKANMCFSFECVRGLLTRSLRVDVSDDNLA